MNILVASFSFPPNQDGVAEAAAAGVLSFLAQGWKVDVATARSSPPRSSLNGKGARVFEFGISGTPYFRDPFRDEVHNYQTFLLKGNWDVIVFHGYSWPLLCAVPFLDQLPAKKVLISHGYGALIWHPVKRAPFGLSMLAHSAYRSIRMLAWAQKIDRWVFLSQRRDFRAFYDHLLATAIRHPGIAVIPNGVDPACTGQGARFRKALNIPETTLVFLCVGYFSRGKNQVQTLAAYQRARIPHSCLVFIAPEPNEWMHRCRALAPNQGSTAEGTKVFWFTQQSREFALDAFAGCDIYVSCSTLETQPISLLEAMRERKPWVALPVGSIPDLPGGLCAKSCAEFSQAMHGLATDPTARQRLGQQGRQAIVSTYSSVRQGDAMTQLIRNLALAPDAS